MSRSRGEGRSRTHDRVTALVRFVIEVEAGRRPVRHLRPFIHPDLQADLGTQLVPSGTCRRLGSVLVQRVGGRVEAVAVLHEADGRAQALALTLEWSVDCWLVTALQRPGQVVHPQVSPPRVLALRTWHTPTTAPPTANAVNLPAGWAAA